MILFDHKMTMDSDEIIGVLKRDVEGNKASNFRLDIYKKGSWAWIPVSYGTNKEARDAMFDNITKALLLRTTSP